jgi:predicted metalloendopeptidase
MDKITKKRAIFKLQSMKALVGFPDELLDDKELKKYFENLTITDNFFENMLAINIFNNYQEFKDYKNDINKTDWRIHYSITEVNAFYLPFDNLISKFL